MDSCFDGDGDDDDIDGASYKQPTLMPTAMHSHRLCSAQCTALRH